MPGFELSAGSAIAGPSWRELFCDEPFVPETITALRNARKNDFIIIGGGGLFMNYFEPFWESFLAIATRVPFCIWGVGYCDMKNEPSCAPPPLIQQIVRHSRLCVVRDELTRSYLANCNLSPPVPCPSIVAVAPRNGAQRRILQVDHYNNLGPERYELVLKLAQEFAARTGRSYRKINNLIPKSKMAAMNELLDLYASADLVVSSRLHGCILALATGRPVLAVSGDHKVDSFMASAGLSRWVCGLDEIESLPERLNDLPNQDPPKAFLAWAQSQNREIGKRVRSLIDQSAKL